MAVMRKEIITEEMHMPISKYIIEFATNPYDDLRSGRILKNGHSKLAVFKVERYSKSQGDVTLRKINMYRKESNVGKSGKSKRSH